jgi:ATP-binding cassette subfamily F protein 3
MRLQLARALMCPADLLLLDEPTNHLDLDALVWLEAWLKRFDGTLLIISHDREFLDAITKVTVHLDEATLTRYTGNYSAFEEMRAERMSQQAGRLRQAAGPHRAPAALHRPLQGQGQQGQAGPEPRQGTGAHGEAGAGADRQRLPVRVPRAASLPNPMLALDGLACGYGSTTIVRNINRTVLAGQRIGILGANGQGKSTLVKTISHARCRRWAAPSPKARACRSATSRSRRLDVLRLDEGPLSHMVRLARDQGPAAREQELRDFLGRFRFTGDMVNQAVGSLSGGEKARLVLAMLVWQRPNLLLLDEPTNHLDLTTREALSMALNEFEGTVMLVSHDRALLREVCDEFWLVTRGGVEPFDGDLDDYQRWLLDVSRATAKGQPAPPVPRAVPVVEAPPPVAVRAAAGPATASEQTRPLRVEIQRIDDRLARLAAETRRRRGATGPGQREGRRICGARATPGPCRSRGLDAGRALAGGAR